MKKPLRLYLIIADEQVFHPRFLKDIIYFSKKNNYKILGITIAKDKYKKGFLRAVSQQIQLWGLVGFSFLACNTILRLLFSKIGIQTTLESIASHSKIPLIYSFDVNEENHIAYLRKRNIDCIISSCGHIFKKDLLNLPKKACINRHSGLLPSYGGVLPVFWTVYFEEKQYGVSAHYMVEKIDRGNVLHQVALPRSNHYSLFTNYLFAFGVSAFTIEKAIENMLSKKIVKKYVKTKNSYFSFPNRNQISKFKKKFSTFQPVDIVRYYTQYL